MNLTAHHRLISLTDTLLQKFGSPAKLAEWLQTPHPDFDRLPPMRFLATDEGVARIRAAL